MAAPSTSKPGLAVDIVLPAPKRKPGAGGSMPPAEAEAAGSDDVQGELYAKRLASAVTSGDPGAILAAFKRLSQHCAESADAEIEEPMPESGKGLSGFGEGY